MICSQAALSSGSGRPSMTISVALSVAASVEAVFDIAEEMDP